MVSLRGGTRRAASLSWMSPAFERRGYNETSPSVRALPPSASLNSLARRCPHLVQNQGQSLKWPALSPTALVALESIQRLVHAAQRLREGGYLLGRPTSYLCGLMG